MSTIQGTQIFIYYWRIHGSVGKAQSSQPCGRGFKPHGGVTSHDVIFNEVYIKSQLSINLPSRRLGATRCCSSLHDHIYKVHAHYCIMTRPLGATLVEVFMSRRQFQVPGCCKHDNPALGGYITQVEITSNMQVPSHCQHAPWHLGANAKSFLLALLKTQLITL